MSDLSYDLSEVRKTLDLIDEQLVQLIIKRMSICAKVAEYKRRNNLPVLDKAREDVVLDKVANNAGVEMAEYCKRVFQELLAVSKDYQQELLKTGKPISIE